MRKSFFEENGGTYSQVGEYYLPNLTLPDEREYTIGAWGMRRLCYLKQHRKGLHALLLTSGKLVEHLHEIDVAAFERREIITRQMAVAQGVAEQLKAENPMRWIGQMMNICACADEIIRTGVIFN